VVRIFLSMFDVHVQWTPVAGRVSMLDYRPGRFRIACDPRAALENEQNRIEITTERSKSGTVMVAQIAGFIARRIACWVQVGQVVRLGDPIGMIRFGSQVDLFLPTECEILVKPGEKVTGAITAVARWPTRV
jgi:phosphatidylserine decarboxylase